MAVAALGAVIHLFAATQAAAIEDGGTTPPLVTASIGVETIVNPAWGLMIAALAVVGGLTHALGSSIVLALGLLGGLAFALATATIAFVDTFDPLFPVAGLAGIWLVATGVLGLTRRSPQVVRAGRRLASMHTGHRKGPSRATIPLRARATIPLGAGTPPTAQGAGWSAGRSAFASASGPSAFGTAPRRPLRRLAAGRRR